MLFQNVRILHALRAIIVIQTFRSAFPRFSSDKTTLCNNNDQTWFSDTLTSAGLLGVVKTLARFQRHPRGPADVNA